MTLQQIMAKDGAILLSIKNTPVWRIPKSKEQGGYQYWISCPTGEFVCVYDSCINREIILDIIKYETDNG